MYRRQTLQVKRMYRGQRLQLGGMHRDRHFKLQASVHKTSLLHRRLIKPNLIKRLYYNKVKSQVFVSQQKQISPYNN